MDEIQLSRGAMRSTIAHATTRPQGESQARTGGPITYDDRDERMILHNLRLHPGMKFRDRRKETGLEMSNSTIKRIARKFELKHWCVKRRPEL